MSEDGLNELFGLVDVDGVQSADIANGKPDAIIPLCVLVPTNIDSTLSVGIVNTLAVAPIDVVVEVGIVESAKK